MKIAQIYTSCLSEMTYFVSDNGEAAVIDPLRDPYQYIRMAESYKSNIKYIFLTHFHADFVSGHFDLAKKTGATIVYGPDAIADFDFYCAKDNEKFQIGDVFLQLLHTPGHTLESSSYLLIDKDGGFPCVFTGDCLFLDDVGRPDLAVIPGSLTIEDLAGMQYDSLRNRIMTLPDDIIVYPNHGFGSSCGKKMKVAAFDTLKNQKKSNYALKADMTKEEFVKQITDGLTAPPQYFPKNAKLNKSKLQDYDEIIYRATTPISPDIFKSLAENPEYLVVDVRTKNNVVEYNVVNIDGPANWFGGNFIADSVIFKGISSGMYLTSQTNVVILDTTNCKISDNHHVNKGIINFYGTVIGHNDFDYCIFNSDGVFRGENTFDTLILTPGKGNTFWFEEEKSQTIYDSLFLRGNQCQNITIKSLNLSKTAYIKKDGGIVQCDFMNVYNVGTEGTTTFYAGKNSTPLPNPNMPPPGWIFDDSQGYIYGFPDTTVYFCYGDVYEIPSVNFNGDSKTQYIWRNMSGDTINTGPVLSITEPGVFSLEALYTDACFFIDTITIEAVDPPVVVLDPGPYCEGDIINVEVTPVTDNYTYLWSNGSTDENLEAQLDLNGTLSVQATETVFGCKSADTTTMQVEPVPKPDDNLPPDQTLLFGETITLDAGEGDTYSWTADNPLITIPDPTQRYITAGGLPDPGVTYEVEVTLGICSGTGDVKLTEYPRCKCDVPNAFSPNGDKVNDVLFVRGSGLHDLTFTVYDRYGKLVFETDNLDHGWDGTINGIKQPKEVYTFYLRGVCEDGGVIEKKGNITLIR